MAMRRVASRPFRDVFGKPMVGIGQQGNEEGLCHNTRKHKQPRQRSALCAQRTERVLVHDDKGRDHKQKIVNIERCRRSQHRDLQTGDKAQKPFRSEAGENIDAPRQISTVLLDIRLRVLQIGDEGLG